MNELTLWDHLYALAIFVGYPLYARMTFPAFVRDVRERGESAKITGYGETLAFGAATLLGLKVLWSAFDRPAAALGLVAGSAPRQLAGLALAVALLALMVWQWRLAVKSETAGRDLREQMGDLLAFMPHTRREERWARAVSVSAGVSEELAFRGFLLWYLEPIAGLWGAALLSVVAFTLAHSYQGVVRLPGIAIAAAVTVGLYLLTGSLLIPILFHVAMDAVQVGFLASLSRRTPLFERESAA